MHSVVHGVARKVDGLGEFAANILVTSYHWHDQYQMPDHKNAHPD